MKYFFSIILLFCLFCAEIFSQRVSYDPRPAEVIDYPVLDSTVLRIRYQMLYVKDISTPEDKTEEIMTLQIGAQISKYSNYHRFLADSLGNVLAREKMARSEVTNKVLPMMARTSPINIFKDYPEKGTITTIDRIPFNAYKYEEELVDPVWNLETGTELVCGYECKKATTTFFGRNYTAWYAPDIPISNGPWKLGGLPGLILKAEDDKGHYSFECIAIEKPVWGEAIHGLSYTPFNIKKEQFFIQQKRYYENPAGTVENTGMIKSELPASARRARPYNPIELNE